MARKLSARAAHRPAMSEEIKADPPPFRRDRLFPHLLPNRYHPTPALRSIKLGGAGVFG